jgi:hypothetical protein
MCDEFSSLRPPRSGASSTFFLHRKPARSTLRSLRVVNQACRALPTSQIRTFQIELRKYTSFQVFCNDPNVSCKWHFKLCSDCRGLSFRLLLDDRFRRFFLECIQYSLGSVLSHPIGFAEADTREFRRGAQFSFNAQQLIVLGRAFPTTRSTRFDLSSA